MLISPTGGYGVYHPRWARLRLGLLLTARELVLVLVLVHSQLRRTRRMRRRRCCIVPRVWLLVGSRRRRALRRRCCRRPPSASQCEPLGVSRGLVGSSGRRGVPWAHNLVHGVALAALDHLDPQLARTVNRCGKVARLAHVQSCRGLLGLLRPGRRREGEHLDFAQVATPHAPHLAVVNAEAHLVGQGRGVRPRDAASTCVTC